jgi:hypothetical protein
MNARRDPLHDVQRARNSTRGRALLTDSVEKVGPSRRRMPMTEDYSDVSALSRSHPSFTSLQPDIKWPPRRADNTALNEPLQHDRTIIAPREVPRISRRVGIAFVTGLVLSGALAPSTEAQQSSPDARDLPSVFDGIARNLAGSPELSTVELRAALVDSSAVVLDARPYDEYAVSHIPGARAVPGKPALYLRFMSPTQLRSQE